jgi:hypothetical protein
MSWRNWRTSSTGGNVPFEIVIRGMVEVGKDNAVTIDGRPATIL